MATQDLVVLLFGHNLKVSCRLVLRITYALKNLFDARKVHVGKTLSHTLSVQLEYRVPGGCHGSFSICNLLRKMNVPGHVFQDN